MSSKRVGGFTLIEIMIVVAIIALLASIALPAYSRYGFRSRRVDGQELVMRVAAAQERFFTTNNAYATTVTSGGLNFVDDLSTHHGPDSYYQVSMVTGAGTYTITATPLLGQANDVCGNLTLDNLGQKKFSGNENNGHCW